MFKTVNAIALPGPVEETSSMRIRQLWLAVLFLLFIIPGLGMDSVQFRDLYFDGRHLANVAFITFFFIMYYSAGKKLQRLMLVMAPLSYLGELLCSDALAMYDYKNNAIPLYVPFGHALVYASGYIIARSAAVQKNAVRLKPIFAFIFATLFIGAGVLVGDIFTLLFGALFFWVLRRKKWEPMYYCIALIAVFVEFVGTALGCWKWKPEIFGVLPAANPPVGTVFIYVGGDVILAKILFLWDKKRQANQKHT